MKRVLVIHYSQSGQLSQVAESVTAPLVASDDVTVDYAVIKPLVSFPFPWPFLKFFDTFPQCVYEDAPAIQPLELESEEYDLVILAYQVWFLSPSLPISAFLQSDQAERLLKNKPVVTLIACRNMWLMAQEKVKKHLKRLGARLVDNVVLTDECGSALSFFATPLWVLTGNKGPFWFGIPRAGVSQSEIESAGRFGEAMLMRLRSDEPVTEPMFVGLGAVKINDKLIASEKIAHRSFQLWGGLLRKLGKPGEPQRRLVLVFYILFLITLILTVVPISAVIKRLVAPFLKERIQRQRDYYSAPSGEALE